MTRHGRNEGAGIVMIRALVALGGLPACTPPSLLTLRGGLDSLRAVVDTMNVRDSLAYEALKVTRTELTEQRDILLSTRATTGSTTQELFEQMQRLEGKLDEAMGRFNQAQRSSPSGTTPGGGDPNQLYDQAAQDLTQGRYSMALQGFRDFVSHYPAVELSDNAQYGIGECYFAQSKFDSAATAYAVVGSSYPSGDKVPAALYKRALCEEKLGHASEARKLFEELVKRFPLAGESQLARERLGTSQRR
jgi:tol-pal system protein YbgF